MRSLALFLAALVAFPAQAQSPIIWGSPHAKALMPGGINLQSGNVLLYDGPQNFIQNGRAEDGSAAMTTSLWVRYNDGAAVAPVDGTGGTVTSLTAVTRSSSASNVAQGTYSWQFVKSASNLQGFGWGQAIDTGVYDIPFLETGAKARISFDYKMSSAAVGSDAFRVYVYDDDNNTMIAPDITSCGGGATPSLTTTTTYCHAEMTFTATNAEDWRVIFHIATTSASASTLYVDNMFFGAVQDSPYIATPYVTSPTIQGTALLKNATGAQPELHLSEDPDNGTNVIKLKAPASTGDVTLTLPDSDGDADQVLKTDGSGVLSWTSPATTTMADNVFNIQDNGDATKQLRFEASGITTGTTRTLTAPDANTTIVGTDATQTLTGKTIDADDNTIIDIDNSEIAASANIAHNKLAALAAGAIILGNGSNVPTETLVTGDVTISDAGVTAIKSSVSLVTPVLGVASATSINKVALTAPASAATLTIADGKTLTASNTLTFTGTDSSSVAFGAGGTVAYTGGNLSQFAATTSAQLAGVLSDETGTAGGVVFSASPTLTGTTSMGGNALTAVAGFFENNDNGGNATVFFRNRHSTANSTAYIGTYQFEQDNDATGAFFARFLDSGGEIGSITAASATTVAFNTSSDERLKMDIVDMKDGLATVLKMRPREYRWKEDGHADKGFIAQELAEVYPLVVSGKPDGDPHQQPMQVDYGKLTPVLTAAIKDLAAEVEALKAEVARLKEGK